MLSAGSDSDGSKDSESVVESDDDNPKRKNVRKVVKKAVPKKKAATPKKKATPKSTPKKAPASKKKAVSESESEGDEEADDEVAGGQNEAKVLKQLQNRTPKEQLVADILCRWWYAMPDWPPADYDYVSRMSQEKLRLVSLDRWDDEADVDGNGFVKCYALTQYKGLFRDAMGNLRDLRPLEGKPCFSELIKKSDKELQKLLTTALTKQIEVLSASNEKNTGAIIADLKDRLKNVGKKQGR